MTCLECQEKLGQAIRTGGPILGTEAHLAGCRTCREFGRTLALMAPALDRWRPEERWERRECREYQEPRDPAPRDPALLAIPGAVAVALGALLAPDWLRLALTLWFLTATILVSIVLVRYGLTVRSEGGIR